MLLMQSFKQIPRDTYAAIVIDDRPSSKVNEFMMPKIQCNCKSIIHVLTVKLAMMKAGRRSTKFHCSKYSSRKEILEKLRDDVKDRDLVLSIEHLKRYEYFAIIHTTRNKDMSHTSSFNCFQLFPNMLLDMMYVYEKLLKNPDHKCDEMMSLSEEHLVDIDFNFTELKGKD